MTEGSRVERAASPLLTLGGIAASFGLAACCALPMLLVAAGLGTAVNAGRATLRRILKTSSRHRELRQLVLKGQHRQQRAAFHGIVHGMRGACVTMMEITRSEMASGDV